MKWLEMIQLRSGGKGSEPLDELLHSTARHAQSGLKEIGIYRHAALETDLSVHLHWESERPEPNGSTFGLLLARALEEFGMVSHSVWIRKRG